MQLQALTCDKCGATLEVPCSTNFVTCSYCNSRLAIKRTDSALYTEVLDRIDKRTEQLAGDMAILRLNSELQRMDREWQETAHGFLAQIDKLKADAQHHSGASATYWWPGAGLAAGVILFAWALYQEGKLLISTCTMAGVIVVLALTALAWVRGQLEGYNNLVKAHNDRLQEYTNATEYYERTRAAMVNRIEHSPE